LRFFHFWNSNLKFEFEPVSNRPIPEPVRAGKTSNRGNRTGSGWFFLTLVVSRVGEPKQKKILKIRGSLL